MRIATVRCTFEISIPFDDDTITDDELREAIAGEECCLATGILGHAFDQLRRKHLEADTCWGCAVANSDLRVVRIEDRPGELQTY